MRAAWLAFGVLCACGGSGAREGVQYEGSAVAGQVVSKANGAPIGLSEVQQTVDATGLAPKEALARLQEERLIDAWAREHGHDQHPKVADAERRARVRALLAVAVEQGTAGENIPNEAIRERFEALGKRMKAPERRAVWHVVFTAERGVEAGAQRAAAQAVLDAWKSAEDPARVFERYQPLANVGGMEMVAEQVPAFDKKAPFARPFKRAIFKAEDVGPIPEPVRSRFGWHAIYVREIVAERDLELSEVSDHIRDQLVLETRSRRLDELVEKLREEARPVYFDEAIQQAFVIEALSGDEP